MDNEKLLYFVEKYRSLEPDEFSTMANRTDLADEAIAALQQVAKERNLQHPKICDKDITSEKLSPTERAEQTKLATALWHSSLSKRIEYQFGGLAIIFCITLLGYQGLRVGGILFIIITAGMSYFASKIGRQYTRSVCANASKKIDEKRKVLRNTSMLLWPLMLIPAIVGIFLAVTIRTT